MPDEPPIKTEDQRINAWQEGFQTGVSDANTPPTSQTAGYENQEDLLMAWVDGWKAGFTWKIEDDSAKPPKNPFTRAARRSSQQGTRSPQ